MASLRKVVIATAVTAACGLLATPNTAEACGGTFCDGALMPVEQTGEVIIFAQDGANMEAHIQIQYDGGDASKFAWIVPVPNVPEVEVGSQRFIDELLRRTVPGYGVNVQRDCEQDPPDPTGIAFIDAVDGGSAPDEPDVVAEGVVGAFDYVVLGGGTSDSIMQWLADNGYSQSADAPSILDAYLEEGSVFLAFRLRPFAGTADIHPVIVRYQGSEPCIPIRLTRVAAKNDMSIRAFFFGYLRTLPINYAHVVPNEVRFDWTNNADNYTEVVSRAVDEAGGRAFITEYAGPNDVLPAAPFSTQGLLSSEYEGIEAVAVVDTLVAQGLMWCSRESCEFTHEMVPGLLQEFLPTPKGVESQAFYACPKCYADQIDLGAWSGSGFAAAYQARIVEPMRYVTDLLDSTTYVTRLFTTMSADEMTEDPLFAPVFGLEDVPRSTAGVQDSICCGDSVTVPTTGRTVWLDDSGSWPTWDKSMPFAERIEQYQPAGPPAVTLDRADTIDALVEGSNANYVCVDVPMQATGTGGTGVPSNDTDLPGSGPQGTGGTGAGADDAEGDDDLVSGCACSSRGSSPLAPMMLFLLGLGLGRQRSRARRA